MSSVFDLSSLNKEQREAVETTEGSVLVLAGAGTGKTKVLTSRIAYIIHENLTSISRILAVTFTNKAANEMRDRALSLLGDEYISYGNSLWIGTFHSLALRMIRPHHEKFNRTPNFSIIDSDDQIRLVKKILKDMGLDDKKYPPKSMAYYIGRWKDQLISPDDAKKVAKKFTNEEIAARIYDLYQDSLDSIDSIDFGDILMICINLFKGYSDILEYYQNKFQYIMVDEYQDTNTSQYMWLKLLSMKHGNICCVGDDDQSIYSWRGADIENILRFNKDFKDAKIIRLEQNYRSTENILKTANVLISNNSGRMVKNLWTDGEKGLPVIIKSSMDPQDESHFIANLIINKNDNGIPYHEMAILVRATFQTRAFEEKFISMGIPYKIVGGMKFYERKEVKDAISYLKLVVNIDDGLAFERIINLPKRGIGIASINKFYQIARERGISLTAASKLVIENSPGSLAAGRLSKFFDMITRWNKLIDECEPFELMKLILEESGYIKMLVDRNTLEDESRIETLKELVNAMREFNRVSDFLDYISLVLDNNDQINLDKVTISTIHAAKGLEYRTVFIPGFEENIIPHQKALEEKGEIGLEEERRLCYVAITRAKKEAYISFCNSRGNFYSNNNSSWQKVNPSRFLYDLPKGSTKFI